MDGVVEMWSELPIVLRTKRANAKHQSGEQNEREDGSDYGLCHCHDVVRLTN